MTGSSGENKTTTEVQPWPQSQPSLAWGLEALNKWFGQNKDTNVVYPGQRVAEFSPQQQKGFNMIEQLATSGKANPVYDTALESMLRSNNIFGAVEDAYGSVIEPTLQGKFMDAKSNPYAASYVEAMNAPLKEQFFEEFIPQLTGNAEMAGVSNTGINALLKAKGLEGLQEQESANASNFYNQMYQTGQQNQLNAANYPANLYQFQAGMLPQEQNAILNFMNNQYQGIGNLVGVGEEQQKLQQAKIGAEQQKFNEGIYSPYDLINAFLGSAYQLGSQGSSQTQMQQGYSPGLAQMLLGGAGMGAGLYGMGGQVGLW